MIKAAQMNFVKLVCQSVLRDMLRKINDGKVPEKWEAEELCQWIADKHSEVVTTENKLSTARKTAYKKASKLL